MQSEVDIAVIGAGAAGIAAGMRLAEAHASFLVLEARDRIGGRSHTVDVGTPVDLGCEWLHSADRNVWRAIGEARGWDINTTSPGWERQSGNIGMSAEEQQAFGAALWEFEDRVEKAVDAPDAPASAYLEPGGRWNELIEAVGGYISGAPLEKVSTVDLARYCDTGKNYRVTNGYGALIAACGAELPISCGVAVSRIDHSGPMLRIETSRGDVRARVAIVAVPTTVLAGEGLRFHPALPDKQSAAAQLPLGHAEKCFLALDAPEMMEADGHLFGATHSAATGSYHLRPFGRPMIEGFFAGPLSETLAREQNAFEFAIEELANLFGSDIRKHLRPIVQTSWGTDPLALGAYSYAVPGAADQRAVLAAPAGRIFFAGEACSREFFSTAHGAHESGRRAADEALAAL